MSAQISRPQAMQWLRSNGMWMALAVGSAGLIVIHGVLLVYRSVNLDEGWYLLAAKFVNGGQTLYHDFAYTQPPLLPYVYGTSLQGLGWGLYQGRAVTMVFALVSAGSMVWAARVRGGAWAAVCALVIWGSSFFAVAYFSYSATYALTGALLMSAAAVAAEAPTTPRQLVGQAVFVGVLVALATATRASVIVVVPLFMVFLMGRRVGKRWWVFIAYGGAFLATAALLMGPFLVAAPEVMLYNIVGFHTDRILRLEWHLQKMVRISGQTMLDLLGLVVVNGILAAGWIVQNWRRREWRAAVERASYEFLLLGCVVALFVVQLAPSTTSSHYNTLQAPLLCVTAGVGIRRWWVAAARRSPRLGQWFALATAVGLAAHVAHQAQVLVRYDLLTWPPVNQVAIVREAAAALRERFPDGGTLLTFNTHLALEAGMDVPPGYEMSIFSYRPDWSTEQARVYHAVNNEILLDGLRDGVDAVAMSDFDLERLYGDRESIVETLSEHYRLWMSFPGFDPFRRRLYVYLPPQFAPDRELGEFAQQPEVVFDNGLVLLGGQVRDGLIKPGTSLDVSLFWRSPAVAPQVRMTRFVHLVDGEGRLVTGLDTDPCRGTCPTHRWLANELIRDEATLGLPEDWGGGTLRVMVGMYDSDSGAVVYPEQGVTQGGDHRVVVAELRAAP